MARDQRSTASSAYSNIEARFCASSLFRVNAKALGSEAERTKVATERGARRGATISVRYLGKKIARSLRFSAISSSLACGGGDARLATGKPRPGKTRAQAEHTRHLCGLVLEHVRGVGRNIDGRPGANGLRLRKVNSSSPSGRVNNSSKSWRWAQRPTLPVFSLQERSVRLGDQGKDPLSCVRRRDSWLPRPSGRPRPSPDTPD